MARWRVGYLIAPGMSIENHQKILEHTVLECNSIAQKAALAALLGPQDWVEALSHEIARKRDLVWEGLGGLDDVSFPKPQGGPNAFISVGRFASSIELFSNYLLEEYGIPVVPGEALMFPGYMRFSFAGEESQLKQAIERFQAALRTYKP